MPFEYLDEQQDAPSGKFEYLDENNKPDNSTSMKGMAKSTMQAGQDVVNALNTPSRKLITGKSFEDIAREKSLAGQDVPAATSRPFDANVPLAGKMAFNNANIAQEKDLLTTPSMILAGVAKPAMETSEAIGNAIAAGKNKLAEAALSPEFAQSKSRF